MDLLLILFIVFGGASFLCIVLFTVSNADAYFSAAFAKHRPKIFGPNAASTNDVVFYWITKVFFVCLVGFLVIYLFNIVRS